MGIERLSAWTSRGFAEKFVRYVEECILAHQSRNSGRFVLGLSGPEGEMSREGFEMLFGLLAESETIDWERVCIFLVEERYGGPEQESNGHLVRTALVGALQRRNVAFSEDQLVLPNLGLDIVRSCIADYQDRLLNLFKNERSNGPHLVALSLGSDMSVAGISPGWYNGEADNWAQAISKSLKVLHTSVPTSEGSSLDRVCVNLAVIRRARNIIVDINESSTSEAWQSVKHAWEMISDAAGLEQEDHRIQIGRATSSPPGKSHRSSKSCSQDPSRRRNAPDEGSAGPHGDFSPPTRRTDSPRGEASERLLTLPVSPLVYIMKYKHITIAQFRVDEQNYYTFVILGAGGDLAKKKTFPALFQLQLGNHLPPSTRIIGCDDSTFHLDLQTSEDLLEKRLRPYLEKESGAKPGELRDFMNRIDFMPVKLNEAGSMSAMDQHICQLAASHGNDNRVFYLALPSHLFATAVERIKTECWPEIGFGRVIVEKPFGRSLGEASELAGKLGRHLQESQIYRIDHYLAKTLILNILTLRFANREFGTLFHNYHVANVRITFQEDIGTVGRAGYFNDYGIIRDIMQNHLMQVLTLIAMEAPASLEAEDVRDEKVKVLKQIRPIRGEDCIIGQYNGYQDDPQIQEINKKRGFASRCPTFATAVLYLDNERWSGVPFIMKAGKGLQKTQTLVRVQFKKAPSYSIFGDQPQNELVICIQPNERIYYKMLAKMPGISQKAKDVRRTVLDLDLKKGLDRQRIPLAYEKLIYDVLRGDSHNFVRRDELEQAWRIFDPLLTELEEEEREPLPYAFGSGGPKAADEFIQNMGFQKYTPTGVAVSGFSDDEVA